MRPSRHDIVASVQFPLFRKRCIALLSVSCLLLTACSGGTSPTDIPEPPESTRIVCKTSAVCMTRVELTPGRYLRTYQSYSLEKVDSLITQAIIVIHGTDRNADTYFQTMMDATTQAGRLHNTLVISPWFPTIDDARLADEPYWGSSGWKEGNLSSPEGPLPRISSYAALDSIVARLTRPARFPKLREIVVTGHSAGGQVVHRYAAASPMENTLAGIAMRYITANPSTYLYLNGERHSMAGWTIPSDTATCPEYNRWHLGLEARNSYANAQTEVQLRNNLVTRAVTVMVGTVDTGTSLLDVTCGANMQGDRRYDRGVTLVHYMNALFPTNKHQLVEVPDIGHSSRGIYLSAKGLATLFQ